MKQLIGIKRIFVSVSVSNKWFHEKGQEFLRPCELEPDHPEEETYTF